MRENRKRSCLGGRGVVQKDKLHAICISKTSVKTYMSIYIYLH